MSDIPEYRTGELPDIDPTKQLLIDTSELSNPKPEDGPQPPNVEPPSEIPTVPEEFDGSSD